MSVRVLVVDADRAVAERVSESLSGAALDVSVARSMSDAVAHIQEHDVPWILLIDWPGLDPSICDSASELLGALSASRQLYVIFTSERASRADAAAGIRLGADEFLQKPFAPDLLRSRIRAAERMLERSSDPTERLVRGLRQGIEHGNGELIVREQARVFRVHFYEHRVAFASDSERNDSLLEALDQAGIPRDETQAAVEEARRLGRGFFDILLDWSLIDPSELRAVTRTWLEQCFEELLACQQPQLLFIPKAYVSQGTLSFELDEVMHSPRSEPAPRTRSSVFPVASEDMEFVGAFFHEPNPPAAVLAHLERVMCLEGAISAALIDGARGRVEGRSGAALDPNFVWSLLQAMRSLSNIDDAAEEIALATGRVFYLARPLDDVGRYVGCLVVDRAVVSLGMARASFAHECEQWGRLSNTTPVSSDWSEQEQNIKERAG